MFLGIGIQNGTVFQRNADNVSELSFAGTARFSGDLLLKASCNGKVLPGFESIVIGKSSSGNLSGSINGLPAGGPYTLEFSIAGTREQLTVDDVLVGDIWVLAGQSNMAGSAFLPCKSDTSPMVHAFYMDNTWGVAKTPIHDTTRAVAKVHCGNPANSPRTMRGPGPGLPFAVEMYKTTGIPQALIACAHGGTSLAQWDPALKKLKDGSLYGAAIERIKMLGGKVAGLLWYQGCNDTASDETVSAYKAKTRKLLNAFRKDCQNPNLPIVMVQLGSYVSEKDCTTVAGYRWLTVRNEQYMLAGSMKNCACVPAIDLELDDNIHLSNTAVVILGKRMAEAMLNLRGAADTMPQIQLKKISAGICKETSAAVFTVEFANVSGSLTAGGLPCGFAVINSNNEIICEATNTRLYGNKAVFQTRIPFLTAVADNFGICYGGALQPHCNIVDGAGRSLPCFVSKVKYASGKVSQFLLHALVSEAIYRDDELADFRLPTAEEAAALKFSPAKRGGFFVAVPRENGDLNKKKKFYYYKFAASVEQDAEYKIMFGADADFALFCDGSEIMRKHTSNPILPDEFKTKLHLTAGVHDFCCVFSSNYGSGWGICCRFTATGKAKPPVFLATDDLN